MNKEDFPILNREINGKRLVYLDNAATSQKPRQVIRSITHYYENSNANVHRGVHFLSQESTALYEEAHKVVAEFINASPEEIVFTKNTTESLNLVAYRLAHTLKEGDEILVSVAEHHSNFVVWQQIAKKKKLKLKIIQLNEFGVITPEDLEPYLTDDTKIFAITHISNVTGIINPLKEIIKLCKENDIITVVDAAQSAPHMKIDVKSLGCDFLAFSGHKMLGPTGIGVLFGKKEHLNEMQPFLYGGGMISKVSIRETTWNEIPWKFEAGTPNISGAIGLMTAIKYLQGIGMDKVEAHEKELAEKCIEELKKIPEVKIYYPESQRIGVVSFNISKVHPHDATQIMDKEGVAVRGGHHCAMPLMDYLGINGTVRASFYIYNTEEDIDVLVESIKKVLEVFK